LAGWMSRGEQEERGWGGGRKGLCPWRHAWRESQGVDFVGRFLWALGVC
jgi:hypothetical protein